MEAANVFTYKRWQAIGFTEIIKVEHNNVETQKYEEKIDTEKRRQVYI